MDTPVSAKPFFADRIQAAEKLAYRLLLLHEKFDCILSLPRGGTVLGRVVGSLLEIPHTVFIVRKIGAPFNPELGLGAVTETGLVYFDKKLLSLTGVTLKDLERTVADEQAEVKRRVFLYRHNRPLHRLADKSIILIDDGIATGVTMTAAIFSLKKRGVKNITVATPVCAVQLQQHFKKLSQQLICLKFAEDLASIGSFYVHFPQLTDDEIVRLFKP